MKYVLRNAAQIYIYKQILFLNESELICLHMLNWFQVSLSNTSIQHYSFIYTYSNGF